MFKFSCIKSGLVLFFGVDKFSLAGLTSTSPVFRPAEDPRALIQQEAKCMAKATVDGTVPCKNCGNTMTVENQKWTGGPDRGREVYVKCLRCQAETLVGVFRMYGNSLVNVKDMR
jgi:hypothetical protein